MNTETTKPAASGRSLDALLAALRGADDAARTLAWQELATLGAPAIAPLTPLLTDSNTEIARAARHALRRMVRLAGRPQASREAAVSHALAALLPQQPVAVQRDLLWMLSEIAQEDAIPAIAPLLKHAELREDARCALLRLPGRKSVTALREALADAPTDFQPALAEALRLRGEKVPGHPSGKLTPSRPTRVEAKGG
jgi:hypothetical protein